MFYFTAHPVFLQPFLSVPLCALRMFQRLSIVCCAHGLSPIFCAILQEAMSFRVMRLEGENTMSVKYPHVLSPLVIRGKVLKNRLEASNSLPHFLQGPESYPDLALLA